MPDQEEGTLPKARTGIVDLISIMEAVHEDEEILKQLSLTGSWL